MQTQGFQPNRTFIAVLVGGSIAATLDILYAFIVFGQAGRSPLWVLQLVASGLLGAEAFESGVRICEIIKWTFNEEIVAV